jgi:hypothetical protein
VKNLDYVGIAMSVLCIVHCVAGPLILFFLPAFATAFLTEEVFVHQVLFGLIILVAIFSFIPGYRLHKQRLPLGLFGAGLILLAFATFFAHDISHELEPAFAIIGSLFIVSAHYFNHKSCHHSCGEHTHIE